MKKIFLTIIICFMASNVHAARWIKCTSTTIGPVTYDRPLRREGDCFGLKLCTGLNNTGKLPGVIEAEGTEWNDAGQANMKCDLGIVMGSRIVSLTAQEISDITAAKISNFDAILRSVSKSQFDGQTEEGQSLRCLADITKREINILRKWTRDFQIEVANSNNLSDLKTGVSGLATLTDRTLPQLKSAVQTCIDDGDVDE